MIWFQKSGNEPSRPETLISTPMKIPVGNCVQAEILGFDDDSYAYISLLFNENIEKTYQEMYQRMEFIIRVSSYIPRHMLSEGLLCIVKLDTPLERRGGIYARGKILELDVTRERVKCLLYDDFSVVVIHRCQVYYSNQYVLQYPEFLIKCQLEDLTSFLGFPLLKLCYEEYLKATRRSDLGICNVLIVNQLESVPTVRITFPGASMDRTFTFILQEFIPTVGKMKYPFPPVDIKGKITHADEQGMLWFQNWDAKQLIRVVEALLINFNPGPSAYNLIPPADTSSWKFEYLFGSKGISIFKHQNGKSFRVKVDHWFPDARVLVSFIDYGYAGIVTRWNLFSAAHYEQNLCFIPPQCLACKFVGARTENDFDKDLFWECIPGDQKDVTITLKDYGVDINTAFRGKITPEADMSIRTPDMVPTQPVELLSQVYQRKMSLREVERSPSTSSNVELRERPVAVVMPMPNEPVELPNPDEAEHRDEMAADLDWIMGRLRDQLIISNQGGSSSGSGN
ncbi:unnamed protein product [Orchesella dallaii]|uniref:Tudor domain-containing protein n=1 Tax=Orchesella dallaii TaxID=48710 RepID=A0ABP1R543_9HEXA